MRYSEKLKARYKAELEIEYAEYWSSFKPDYIFVDIGCVVGRVFIGSQLCIWPSGKIYAPWTTNQTMRDMIMDQAFTEAFEELCDDYGLCYECESGDVFLCEYYGCESDNYISYDGGDTFEYDGSTFEADKVRANMEAEGHYPDVFECDSYGELTYYVVS